MAQYLQRRPHETGQQRAHRLRRARRSPSRRCHLRGSGSPAVLPWQRARRLAEQRVRRRPARPGERERAQVPHSLRLFRRAGLRVVHARVGTVGLSHRGPIRRRRRHRLGAGARHLADPERRVVGRHRTGALSVSSRGQILHAEVSQSDSRLHNQRRPGVLASLPAVRGLARQRVDLDGRRHENARFGALGACEPATARSREFAGTAVVERRTRSSILRRCRRPHLDCVRQRAGAVRGRGLHPLHVGRRPAAWDHQGHSSRSVGPPLAGVCAERPGPRGRRRSRPTDICPLYDDARSFERQPRRHRR